MKYTIIRQEDRKDENVLFGFYVDGEKYFVVGDGKSIAVHKYRDQACDEIKGVWAWRDDEQMSEWK